MYASPVASQSTDKEVAATPPHHVKTIIDSLLVRMYHSKPFTYGGRQLSPKLATSAPCQPLVHSVQLGRSSLIRAMWPAKLHDFGGRRKSAPPTLTTGTSLVR